MKPWRSSLTLVAALSLCLSVGEVFSASNQYIESFNTTAYKDAATTAFWDVATGELKLAPFAPSLVGAYNTPGSALGTAVAGDLAFVADQSSGLHIINIINPAAPVLAGTYDTPGNAYGVAVDGDLVFVADEFSGLQIINIANPASPSLVGTYDTPGSANGVVVAGDLAFVADHTSGLQIINITNPASPSLVGTYNTPGSALGVAVDGDLAFVADDVSGLQIINIANPASPSLAGTYDTPGAARSVAVAGDLVFVADQGSGLQIISIANPASPSLVSTYDTSGSAWGVAVDGELAFVGDGTPGLGIVQFTNRVLPTRVGGYDTPAFALDVAVKGDLAYVADNTSGLQIINITNPASPTLVGSYDTPGFGWSVTVAGDLALVADHTSGVYIINVTNPASPTLVGTYDTPGIAADIVVAGDLAFVADGDAGLQIINIANPASPSLVGTYNTPGFAVDVVVAGDLAFVADEGGGLKIISIANPASPSLVGTYNTAGMARDVVVAGDLALVAAWANGLEIINVANPASPSLVGTYDTPGTAWGVAVAGNLAFVADYDFGLHSINIADPTSPTLVGTFDTWAFASDVEVAGEFAYVPDQGSGLHVIQVFNHAFNTVDNAGRSLKINATTDPVIAVRLSTTQTPTVAWEISANAGVNWQTIAPNNSWNFPSIGGNDLRWRSTHTLTGSPAANPTVSDLQMEWLYESALVDAITDIPNDQGGWVRLKLIRSGRDFAGETSLPIEDYGVWRRVDNAAMLAEIGSTSRGGVETIDPRIAEVVGALPIFSRNGSVFVQSVPGEVNATLPPGTWELVQTIPALQQQTYLAAIPTLEDSSQSGPNHTVLVVTAHTTTPSIWYASPPDSGYSKDNIAPSVPSSFAVAYHTGNGNTLSWGASPDEDFQYFKVYRSTDPNFTPSPATHVHSTTSTGWVDPNYNVSGYHYKVTALDYAGNESGPAVPGSVTAVGDPIMPEAFSLYPNAPNPFHPRTVIRYDVPEPGGAMLLQIYDASGRVVKSLVEGTQTAGQKAIDWDGYDDAGRPVATGVYFYRLTAPNYTKTHKMVLMK